MKRSYALVAGVVVIVCLAFAVGRFTGGHRSEPKATSRRVLYYVDPMHPSYRSDKPGIAPDCGMALEPVYEGETSAYPQTPLQPGGVALSAERQQLIGIRVAVATTSTGLRTIRTTGRIVPDDNRLYRIQAGFDGWVDSIADTPPGSVVKKNQVLAALYGPEIRSAELNYISFVTGMERVKQNMPDMDQKQVNDSKRVSEEQLRLLGMGEQELEQLATDRHASNSLSLVAPGDGIVLARSVTPHQRFEKGVELYRIADLSKVWILADFTESDAHNFKPGTEAVVTVNHGRQLRARVTDALPQFNPATQTMRLRLEAGNAGFQLRPGMIVDVELPESLPRGLTVPAQALIDSGNAKRVFVDRGNGYFEPREVKTGWRSDDRVEIVSGLSKGDRVVAAGAFLVDSEARLKSIAASVPATKMN